MGFVFYDSETTGLETEFDQILQFAAVRTDAELNEVDRFETRCRLLPHVVPSPKALAINETSADQLSSSALLSHYEAIIRIYQKFRTWSPAVFTGYNSIRFDEKLLQHEFYKNLLPPYLTSCHNNCRSDVMRAIIAAALYEPKSIIVPIGPHGTQTFTLEQIAAANGCSSAAAHDALGDTLATLRLARLLAERVPEIWSALMRLSQKAAVLDYLASELILILSEKYFGKLYSWHITRIGESESRNTNQYVFVLNYNLDDLSKMTDTSLARRLNSSPKPVRVVKANAAPILMPCDRVPANIDKRDIDLSELERRAERLQNDEDLRRRLIKNFEANQKKYEPSAYVEQKLYEELIDPDDKSRMEAFHKAAWQDRPAITEAFADPRLRELGLRLIHCEHPEVLDSNIRSSIDITMATRLTGSDENFPCRTLPDALEEMKEIMVGASPREKTFLKEHQRGLIKRLDNAQTVLAHTKQ